MAVTDYKYPGTCANLDNGTSGVDWSNYNYAKADDTNYASALINKSSTDYLLASNFGFSSSDIPVGATIDGIEIAIGKSSSVGTATTDSLVSVCISTTKYGNIASSVDWGTSIAESVYGGATTKTLNDHTFTRDEILASTFGACIGATTFTTTGRTAYVDYIKIRVYYTEGGGATVKPHYYYLQQ